ncbi:MAG: hypothetical protein M1826_003220 [Phylliscum demangeonii]|nr:MAG: hypothetical protein M1826_003220 [Phylliscum demangeonii]
MERISSLLRAWWPSRSSPPTTSLRPSAFEYEPLTAESRHESAANRSTTTTGAAAGHDNNNNNDSDMNDDRAFSWMTYAIFLLLGVAMLWAWNMFLAAAPYFQRRFRHDAWILAHFQSAIMSNATVTNLGAMLVLTRLQAQASYPKRILASLVMTIGCFMLLALSTVSSLAEVGPRLYFAFLMTIVFGASLAAGLSQNGVFAYVSGFGRREYTQAIMTGQAVAGVLPCIAQIVTTLAVRQPQPRRNGAPASPVPSGESSRSALAYFLTATAITLLALGAFLFLLGSRRRSLHAPKAGLEAVDRHDSDAGMREPRKSIGMVFLFHKLRWRALALFTCFAVTMVYPVFTQAITSVHRPISVDNHADHDHGPSRLLQPATFIPLAFLFWNTGDLLGRLLPSLPFSVAPSPGPLTLFFFALLRTLFVPLYLVCNLHGRGARVPSDLFYLVVVQAGFGLTNGWLASTCMTGAARDLDDPAEREAAGGFMGLMLVAGLSVGSLLSFAAATV